MLIVKVPLSSGNLGKNKGTSAAPDAIVSQLKDDMVNERGVLPVLSSESIDVDNANHTSSIQQVFEKAKNLLSKHPVFIGGDHSLTYSTLRAFSETHDDLGFIVFDAHPDLMGPFEPPTHDNYLRMAIKAGIVQPGNVVLVGTRTHHKSEHVFLDKNRIKHFPMRELAFSGIHEVCDAVMAAGKSFGSLYISIDIDVIDPAFCPGTGYLEPAGMSPRELLYFIHRFHYLKNVIAYDIVEVNPSLDESGATVKVAAKILTELY